MKPTVAKTRAPASKDALDLSALSDFTVWAEGYSTNLSATSQTERLGEGESLSVRRRLALKHLIQTDPAKALQLALPQRLRDRMPLSVQQNLEAKVSGRGFLGVLSADDFDSGKCEFHREVRIDSRSFEAYVYGRRAFQMTHLSIFLHGIALDGLMAVHEDSVRRLEPGGPGAGVVETRDCVVCRAPVMSQGTPVLADLGDRVVGLCSESHFRKLSAQIAGDEGGIHGNGGGPVQDSWSQGLKRLLYMRVAFPDDPGEPIGEGEAYNLMNNVNTWYVENSYDSTSILSDVTPLLMLPHTKDWYSVEGANVLLADAREAARATGFNTDNYDLDIVRHSRVPGFNWNGQSYVGGKGCWLQTSSLGVAAHELGHNYGLFHANFWSATADSVIGAGSNVEYGNTFDTMGNAAAGSYQFNVIWKNRLDWLPAGFFHVVTNSGLYRLYAFDVPQLVSSCKYGLRIKKDFDRAYWAEFRQKFVQNPWTQNGILLNWDPWDNGAGNSAGGTQLLDTTPGTPAGNSSKDDSAVVLGRTFTDPSAGIHITPVAKGGTAPETWIDVQVNLGFFPSNLPPLLQLAADSTSVGTNVAVTFTANASDSNGDTLAYGWDFGDLTFGPNAPTASKQWSIAGEYVVRCVVSNMKGGVASRFVVVTVGSPGTYRVTGRITNAVDQPLEGVRVHNGMTGSDYRGTYTDSDGNYALVNLTASSYSLGAVKYGYTLQPTGWVKPVVVNGNVPDLNWSGTAKPMVTLTGTDLVAAELNLDTATVTLSRTGPTNSSLTVNYMVTGTAGLDWDYILSPPLTTWPIKITLPAGVSSTNFVVTPIDDTESEGPETVVFTLAESPDYVIGPDAEVTVVIQDDETAMPPPVIAMQPQSQTNVVGGTASFSALASGTAPLSYQWRFNGGPIPGATASSYNRSILQRADAGNYSVQVTNADGVALSSNAVLTIPFAASAGSLASSTNPALPAQPVEFTLTLIAVAPASGIPTGAVQFKIDGTNAGAPVSLSGGVGSYTNASLAHGLHTVAAEYAGDANFTGTTNLLSPNELINTPPVAGADTIVRDPASGVKVSIAMLLSNDTDADAVDLISFLGVSPISANGGTVVSNSGWIFYTPSAGFTNTDTFTYTIGDGWAVPVTGVVTVNLRADSGPSPTSPNLTIIVLSNGQYVIRGDGIPDRAYRIQYVEQSQSTDWQTLGTAAADPYGIFEFSDINGSSQRFYRSVYP